MRDRYYCLAVKNTSDEAIAELLEFGTVEILTTSLVKLKARSGLKDQLKLCKSVISVIQ